MARLDGKTALITGGTTGIGLETAKLFQQEGARIALTGQNQERLNEAAQKLGSETVAIRANMQSLADIEAMALQVKEQLGGLDVLFVNAGITKSASLAEVDEAHIDEQMGINFKGAFFTIQKVVPFIRDRGSIVLTTSCLNQMGMPGMSIYADQKQRCDRLPRHLVPNSLNGESALTPSVQVQLRHQLTASSDYRRKRCNRWRGNSLRRFRCAVLDSQRKSHGQRFSSPARIRPSCLVKNW